MGLPDLADTLNKFQKLRILAFSDQQRNKPVKPIGTFEAMFNPETIKQRLEVEYSKEKAKNSSDSAGTYICTKPSDLTLDLLLDGTGVTEGGTGLAARIPFPPGPATRTVSERVQTFIEMCALQNGKIHRPNYLRVVWGDLWGAQGFDGQLISLDITYTRFGRDGKPLRASLSIVLRSDAEIERQLLENKPSSPDLTHTRLVKAGDTLPLLAEEVYGSPDQAFYLARANDLDDLRFVAPGTRLRLPPLPGHGKRGTESR